MKFWDTRRMNALRRGIGLVTATMLAGMAFAQSSVTQTNKAGMPYSEVIQSKVSAADALAASASGQTIPLAQFSFVASKDGLTYTETIVGTNPLTDQSTTTINVLLVPLVVKIGSTIFDPTANDNCIAGATISPLAAMQQSPILQNVIFDGGSADGHGASMDGVDVGTTTYIDAFRRAEF